MTDQPDRPPFSHGAMLLLLEAIKGTAEQLSKDDQRATPPAQPKEKK